MHAFMESGVRTNLRLLSYVLCSNQIVWVGGPVVPDLLSANWRAATVCEFAQLK